MKLTPRSSSVESRRGYTARIIAFAGMLAAAGVACAADAPATAAPAATPASASAPAATAMGKPVDFAKQVQPFFSAHCYVCHGPTAQKGKIRFDDRDVVMNARGVLTPGDSSKSALYMAISSAPGAKGHMPAKSPTVTAAPPTADEIAMIKAWIDQGAKWPDSMAKPAAPAAGAAPAAAPASSAPMAAPAAAKTN